MHELTDFSADPEVTEDERILVTGLEDMQLMQEQRSLLDGLLFNMEVLVHRSPPLDTKLLHRLLRSLVWQAYGIGRSEERRGVQERPMEDENYKAWAVPDDHMADILSWEPESWAETMLNVERELREPYEALAYEENMPPEFEPYREALLKQLYA